MIYTIPSPTNDYYITVETHESVLNELYTTGLIETTILSYTVIDDDGCPDVDEWLNADYIMDNV